MKDDKWTFQKLSSELIISQSECHAAIQRCGVSGLFNNHFRKVNKMAFKDFLISGLKYVFPPKVGKVTRGVLMDAKVFGKENTIIHDDQSNYVWPFVKGRDKGQGLEPLYYSVPEVVLKDIKFYKFMVLVDLLRIGTARERAFAVSKFDNLLEINK